MSDAGGSCSGAGTGEPKRAISYSVDDVATPADWVGAAVATLMPLVEVVRAQWTFAGSDEGGRRAAAIYTLNETAKLNDIDPRAWFADVLARLPDHPAKRIGELLPWNWKPDRAILAA